MPATPDAVNETPAPSPAPPSHPRPARGVLLAGHVQLRRLRDSRMFSPRNWASQLVFWVGAVIVALIAIAFAALADRAVALFGRVVAFQPLLAFVVVPAGLALSVLLTRTVFPGAQGSGIPQVIVSLHLPDRRVLDTVLSLRIAFGKIVLTLLGLACGASIGREGPTVQVGAAVMNALGRFMHLPRTEMQRGLVLAGGAAGIAAAFNTPLAGIVFAIEELSHSFEARTSGTVLTAVILAGIATIAFSGNYTYFGTTSAQLAFGSGWIAVLVCGVCGGAAGGLFSTILVRAARYGFPGPVNRLVRRHPIGFAACCGAAIAAIGVASHGTTYGTGYAQARAIVEGGAHLPPLFFVLKFAASVLSYLSGIPGGIFAPSLAVGAGLGDWLSHLLPDAPESAVVLLAMVGYFSGVVQAPITAIIIVMEMTDNQHMMVPLMATAMVAFGVSRLVCPHPIYGALADIFLRTRERTGRRDATEPPGEMPKGELPGEMPSAPAEDQAGAKPNAAANRRE